MIRRFGGGRKNSDYAQAEAAQEWKGASAGVRCACVCWLLLANGNYTSQIFFCTKVLKLIVSTLSLSVSFSQGLSLRG